MGIYLLGVVNTDNNVHPQDCLAIIRWNQGSIVSGDGQHYVPVN
jgi:hypothetical protein